MRRHRESGPYRASARTPAQGAPASSAAAIRAPAVSGLVMKGISSRPPAFGPLALVLGPGFRQIQTLVDQRLPVAAGIGQKHADLTVFDPPRRAAILP